MRKELKNYIMIICFLLFIFGFAVAGVLSEDREFSDNENRYLQQMPEFSWKNLKDGEFTSDIESYMSDQIFMKDQLVSLKTVTDRALLKNYQNGVYFGKDGYYIQDYQENRELVKKNVELLNSFAEGLDNDVQVSFLLAPNAVSVLSDKLPAVNQTDDQLDTVRYVKSILSDRITLCCPYEELKQANEEGEQVYYRTDHHWTAAGAQTAFDALMTAMGESIPNTPYSKIGVSEFYGTLYSKAPYQGASADTVDLVYGLNNELTVTYVGGDNDKSLFVQGEHKDGNVITHRLYDDSWKDKKDKYATYLGGNFSLTEIDSEGESDENVLIIKDSYANAAMPYFCQKYKHVSMIDLRYYHMEDLTVSEYIEEKDIDKVIYLYNIDFLNSDNNFVWLE